MAVAADTNLFWYGRPAFAIGQRLAGRESKPLSIIVFDDECPHWECLGGVVEGRVHDIGHHARLIDLSPDSDAIAHSKPDQSDLPAQVSALSRAIGGPMINAQYEPTG